MDKADKAKKAILEQYYSGMEPNIVKLLRSTGEQVRAYEALSGNIIAATIMVGQKTYSWNGEGFVNDTRS